MTALPCHVESVELAVLQDPVRIAIDPDHILDRFPDLVSQPLQAFIIDRHLTFTQHTEAAPAYDILRPVEIPYKPAT